MKTPNRPPWRPTRSCSGNSSGAGRQDDLISRGCGLITIDLGTPPAYRYPPQPPATGKQMPPIRISQQGACTTDWTERLKRREQLTLEARKWRPPQPIAQILMVALS